jgi:triosephosphate isomerase (TIM)
MRQPVMAGNWKMYKTGGEAAALARELVAGSSGQAQMIVAPPFTALASVADVLRGSSVKLAAQNMHAKTEGAFTGEIAPTMLKAAGCTHVILGHSERRTLFGETDEGVAQKGLAAWEHGLVPILCIGETLEERDAGRTFEVVERQLERALQPLSRQQVTDSLVAYEPVWAIGTGRNATPAQAQEVHALIRARVGASHGADAAEALRILYGGSVKPDNIAALMAQPDVDGALVGGASLKADSFLSIVHYEGGPRG